MLVDEHEWGAESVVELRRPPVKGIMRYLRGEPKYPCVQVRVGFHMSGLTITLRQRITDTMRLALFDVNTPVDEEHTQTYWILARSFIKARWADFDTHRRNMIVFEQDRRIVEDIEPELAPDLSDEVSVKSDALQIAFRRRCQQYVDRGWGIDGTKLAEAGTKRAMVIPSPARREDEALYLLRPVPVTEAKPNVRGPRGDAE